MKEVPSMNEHDEAEWTKNEAQTEDHEETNTSLEEQTSKQVDDTEEVPMPEETKIHETHYCCVSQDMQNRCEHP